MNRLWSNGSMLLVAVSLLAGCGSDPSSAPADDDEMGTEAPELTAKLAKMYGGEGVTLDLTASGGRLELDCAGGTLSAPLRVDGKGRFSVAGTFTHQTGMRPLPGHEPKPEDVRYRGVVTGSHMTLRFTTASGSHTFSLDANKGGVIHRCL